MITKRVIVIIKNVITLIHYGIKYLAMRILDYQEHLKTTLDYLDKPRYISTDYEDNMEYYDTSHLNTSHLNTSHLNTSHARDTFNRDTFDRDTSNKWDKKSAPYCETP